MASAGVAQSEVLRSPQDLTIEASYFIDATPLADLLSLAGVEHIVGAESRDQTGEPHASPEADWRNQQAFTFCFAINHLLLALDFDRHDGCLVATFRASSPIVGMSRQQPFS